MQGINNSDDVLLKHLKQGDTDSFNLLFNKYYKELCNFSYLIISNKQLAEEVVADVFVKIWQKREDINITTSIKSYLYKSTKNTTISYIRKKRIDEISLDEMFNVQEVITSNPEDLIIQDETLVQIKDVLSILPTKSKLVFQMHRFNQLKYKDIAEIMNVSVKSVEKHMSKSMKILREYKTKYELSLTDENRIHSTDI